MFEGVSHVHALSLYCAQIHALRTAGSNVHCACNDALPRQDEGGQALLRHERKLLDRRRGEARVGAPAQGRRILRAAREAFCCTPRRGRRGESRHRLP